MKLILEKLDIEDSLKEDILEKFEDSVNAEAMRLVEEKEKEYKEYLDNSLEELENDIDKYLNTVIEKYLEDNSIAIEESINAEKTEAILEGFNSLTISTGVTIAQIAEAKEESDNALLNESQNDAKEYKELSNSLMNELIEEKKLNSTLMSTGLIQEVSENMTILEKEKFKKLASMIEYDEMDAREYLNKLETIRESIVNNTTPKKTKPKEIVTESSDKYVSKATHLF